MLAHALANRLGVHFFKVDGASLTGSPLLGVPEGRVRALFTLARLIQPCVVFIDECESMLSARTGGGGEGGASAGKIVAQFLTELNDLPPHVVLVLASNMPWTLDPAITRRISCRVYIPLPDPGGRSALIRMDVARASVSLSAPAHALASPPSDSVFWRSRATSPMPRWPSSSVPRRVTAATISTACLWTAPGPSPRRWSRPWSAAAIPSSRARWCTLTFALP